MDRKTHILMIGHLVAFGLVGCFIAYLDRQMRATYGSCLRSYEGPYSVMLTALSGSSAGFMACLWQALAKSWWKRKQRE